MQSLWIGEFLLLIFFTFSGITSTAYMMVLRQQGCYAQTYVAGTGYSYFYILKIIHNNIVFFLVIIFQSTPLPTHSIRLGSCTTTRPSQRAFGSKEAVYSLLFACCYLMIELTLKISIISSKYIMLNIN